MPKANPKHPSRWLTAESNARQRSGALRDRDNTDSVITYMLDRGAFADHKPLRLHSEQVGGHRIELVVEGLPWNPAAPKRVVALVLLQRTEVFTKHSRFSQLVMEEIARAPIPHWDYDGMDPLILREPWERAQANRYLDCTARWREEDSTAWEIGAEADNGEACEHIGMVFVSSGDMA